MVVTKRTLVDDTHLQDVVDEFYTLEVVTDDILHLLPVSYTHLDVYKRQILRYKKVSVCILRKFTHKKYK